ncbi:MAG: DUF3365 domain-containing protein [Flavobacteriaceae bacterium]|nr:DUF3365 domain-containing protein [Flavobacteriaceae bacterium]MDZ4148544.1 DUF3365 domain-containing protein [Flavobacteriaceae bacterium]
MKSLSILSIVSLLFFGCNNNPKTVQKDLNTADTTSAVLPKEHPGKKLMETNCYLCHSPTAAHDTGRIAPPMVAIKAHYLQQAATKETFVEQMVTFVNNPTAESAKLRGAVKRFGVMPKQQFPDGVVAQIADYIYNYQIEEPTWFKAHWKDQGFGEFKQPGKKWIADEKPKTYEEIGLEYALSTKTILGKNLMGAIQKEGTLSALEFCNIQAIPLTDSMATAHRANIKRVSDKNRNPNNKANAEELEHIALYKKQIAANIEPTPTVIDKGDKVQFYYPITTNSMCLQCHGNAKNIQPQVRTKLLELYPNDLATGYSENEVRGIWSIQFDKTEK